MTRNNCGGDEATVTPILNRSDRKSKGSEALILTRIYADRIEKFSNKIFSDSTRKMYRVFVLIPCLGCRRPYNPDLYRLPVPVCGNCSANAKFCVEIGSVAPFLKLSARIEKYLKEVGNVN